MAMAISEEYNVFLSFRGPDARNGFADSLFEFLKGAGLRVFMDDEELRVGESIGEKIHKAIYDSKIFLPIFTQGYASSRWCMKEIAWMVDCMEEFPGKKEMLPLFYDVEVNDVKLKTDLYTNQLIELEKTSSRETIERWKKALIKVPAVKGWNLTDVKGQGKLIKRIAEDICHLLRIKQRSLPTHVIGIEDQVQNVMDSLDCGSRDVRILVIHGMGGIGKTTLASVVFNKLCMQFQGCSFLADVKKSSADDGILNLQNKLLDDVHRFWSYKFRDENDAMNCIHDSLSNKNVLVVLDDVSNMEQIKKLVGMGEWLGLGSRVIITTRNLGCMANVNEIENTTATFQGKKIYIFPMRELSFDDSLQLLCLHAFGKVAPPSDYEQLLRDILSLTRGIPLAIEVMGSCLRGQNTSNWKEMWNKLIKVPPERLYQEILMSSHEMLDREEKEIFLDIAFRFAGQDKTIAFYFWKACGFHPIISINTLISFALVKIDHCDRIWMHDLHRDLGREADRRKSDEVLGRRSWLCNEDAKLLLRRKKETEFVKALKLDSSHAHNFTPAELSRLPNLKFLELTGGNFTGCFEDDGLSELRWFSWRDCALNFRGTDFFLENLAVLRLSVSNIDETWAGWKELKTARNLKSLDLLDLNLTMTPNFSSFLSLERLEIYHEKGELHVHPSIGDLKSLKSLALVNILSHPGDSELPSSFCDLKFLSSLVINGFKLKKLPENFGELKCLKTLEITGCDLLCKLPDSFGDLESLCELFLSYDGITELPESIGKLMNLTKMNVSRNELRGLPATIGDLVRLEVLDVSFNRDLGGEIPSEFGKLQSLKTLDLSWTQICGLPSGIYNLSSLESLWLGFCDEIRELPDLPLSLTGLGITFQMLKSIRNISSMTSLVALRLGNGHQDDVEEDEEEADDDNDDVGVNLQATEYITHLISHLQKLEDLTVRLSPKHLYTGFDKLSRLKCLELSCEDPSVMSFPSGLESLKLYDSTHLSSWGWLSDLEALGELEIHEAGATDISFSDIVCPRKLNRLKIKNCVFLERVHGISGLWMLRDLGFVYCPELVEIGGLQQLLKSLYYLEILRCDSIPSLPNPSDHEISRRLVMVVKDSRKLRDYFGLYKDYEDKQRQRQRI